MSNPEVADGLNRLFDRRSRFILIGLTGRTGSVCTTTANLLSKEFLELRLPEPNRVDANAEGRKYRITKDFMAGNWKPFFTISISNVILSFLLDSDEANLRGFFNQANLLGQANQLDEFVASWNPAREAWNKNLPALTDVAATQDSKESLLAAWQGPIAEFFKTVRDGLGPASTKILQLVGDNLRKSGEPFNSSHVPAKFYELPDRVSLIIEIIRDTQRVKQQPAYVVLDALRNPFELLYFRERFAAFYVFAVSTPDEDRERRLSVRKHYTAKQILDLDEKEYPEKGAPLAVS